MAEGNPAAEGRNAGRKSKLLKDFYAVNQDNENARSKQNVAENSLLSSDDPLNIDRSSFDPEEYLRKLKQEKNLGELMDTEHDMARQIRLLDSEMQTLVYENYNKFISATDTIRLMKRDFHKMEAEMEKLNDNVTAITELSSQINSSMQENRLKITKLSGVHSLLKKLQFLFELPARLEKCLQLGAYQSAVTYYLKTRAVLRHYQHMESFSGIQADCTKTMDKIAAKLKDTFYDKNSTPQQLAQCVGLLLHLGEPPAVLCDEYLQHTQQKLHEDIQELETYLNLEINAKESMSKSSTKSSIAMEALFKHSDTTEEVGNPFDSGSETTSQSDTVHIERMMVDVLEFIDHGSNGFLSNLSLTIAAYENLFVMQTRIPSLATQAQMQDIQEDMSRVANEKLCVFVNNQLQLYFVLVQRRLILDKSTRDNAMLVRALDRFFRRMQATCNLIPNVDLMSPTRNIVMETATTRCLHYKEALEEYFLDCITDARHLIAAPKTVKSASLNLADLVMSTSSSILNQVKSALADVQLFTARDINFSSMPFFSREFALDHVREGIIVKFIQHMSSSMLKFCDRPRGVSPSSKSSIPPPALLLLLSKICKDFETSTIAYILTLTDEQFAIRANNPRKTNTSELVEESGNVAQKLLESYVKRCGTTVSRMIQTSIEARDWSKSVEPRQVRAVMRRVVEDITTIDQQVGMLYEEGLRKARSSDSSKRASHMHAGSTSRQRERGTHWEKYAQSSNMDNSLMSNINKLFSERVDVFGPVEFSRTSILTGIIKIAIKTFVECVRLKRFSKYGLQQLQVDCHYLQMYLWRFVSDENIVHSLLDEVLTSGVHRCVEPVMMEASVIEVICEKG